ncbi:MAG: hypothetical protein ACHQWU_11165 [Gemmatimonadales bacterium]
MELKMSKKGLIALGAMVALGQALHAQTCIGSASFLSGPARIGAGVSISDNVKSYGLDLAVGAPAGAFGSATVARAEYDGIDGGGTVLGASAGYAIDATPAKTMQFCPQVGYEYQSGPDVDSGFGTISTSAHDFSLGGSFGGRVAASPTFDFVPFASAAYVIARAGETFNGTSSSVSEDFVQIGVGAGFVIGRTLTLQPLVSFPVGLEGGKSIFQIAFALNFGSSPTP